MSAARGASAPGPPPPPPGPTAASEIERVLRSIAGVLEVQVRPGDRGQQRLRLRLDPHQDTSRIAARVATALQERFGIALGVEQLLTAETAPATTPPPPPPPSPARSPSPASSARSPSPAASPVRPPSPTALPDPRSVRQRLPRRVALRATAVEARGGRITARVDLARGPQLVSREVVGPATRAGRLRALADATVAAVDALTEGGVRAGVDQVLVRDQADPAHVTVTLTVVTEHGESHRLGAALTGGDAELAVVRATLDALNRLVDRSPADASDG